MSAKKEANEKVIDHVDEINLPKREHNVQIDKPIEKITVQDEAKAEKIIAKQEKSMKEKLQSQPKVKLMIPIDPLNPNEPAVVGINGVIYSIPRGKEVDVPQAIAKVWNESYNKTLMIQMRNKIKNLDSNKEVEIFG